MTTVASGCYKIVNARHPTLVISADGSRGSPLIAGSSADSAPQSMNQWNVVRLTSGRYTIQNVETTLYASIGSRAPIGSEVTGESHIREWEIREAQGNNNFSIVASDTSQLWGFVDGEEDTSVALAKAAKNLQNQWRFVPISGGSTLGVRSIPSTPGRAAAQGYGGIPDGGSQGSGNSEIVLSTGRTDWKTAKQDLGEGTYRIWNSRSQGGLVIIQHFERQRSVAPVQLWGDPRHTDLRGRWRVRFTDSGLAIISSTWPEPGDDRYLGLGPIIRPDRTLCRLYRVPSQPLNTYYISTDTTSNPPLVMQAPSVDSAWIPWNSEALPAGVLITLSGGF
ncbi:hypothetical protein M407DRAFT_6860 [Tulasnella calospora MUT 4182]|uniref:Ricin B lectin domain-containing protein n=1 Tax=Tulasnella calospora MUT 4182 TaxID=1051891 RepID=A0A0C3QC32_9AGAM|nr:hypothetical protein M407DRAFT_6860 [Tulasnella calospora MUT 4182]